MTDQRAVFCRQRYLKLYFKDTPKYNNGDLILEFLKFTLTKFQVSFINNDSPIKR